MAFRFLSPARRILVPSLRSGPPAASAEGSRDIRDVTCPDILRSDKVQSSTGYGWIFLDPSRCRHWEVRPYLFMFRLLDLWLAPRRPNGVAPPRAMTEEKWVSELKQLWQRKKRRLLELLLLWRAVAGQYLSKALRFCLEFLIAALAVWVFLRFL